MLFKRTILPLIFTAILYSCSTNNGAVRGNLLEISLDSKFWIESMKSQLEKDAVNDEELKRSFFRLTMKSTHLYREFHMINDHYELQLGSKLIDIRQLLDRKSQLSLWF